MRYRVDLEELLAFVDRLQSFEQRAEAIAVKSSPTMWTMIGNQPNTAGRSVP